MYALRRLLLVMGSALAVLLVAEIGVRLLGDDLPAVEEWADATTATKVGQMDDLDCAEVVFVGNSVARDDLDPATFSNQDPAGRTAYNAALDAAGPQQVARWLPEEVIPRLDPNVIVWVLTSPDLNDAAPASQAALAGYQSSIAGRSDVIGRVQRPLMEHLALVRHREALTDPATLWDALSGPDDDAEEGSGLIGPLGEGRSRADLRYVRDDPAVAGFVRDQLLASYSTGGAQADATEDLIDELQDDDRVVVLVMPPVTDEFVDLHPDATAWAEYRSTVQTIAGSTGADLVDLTELGDESWFADTHHLNADGARELTTALTARLPPGDRSCEAG